MAIKTKPKTTGYCVRCHKTVKIKDPEVVEMRNDRLSHRDYCPYCGRVWFPIFPRWKTLGGE